MCLDFGFCCHWQKGRPAPLPMSGIPAAHDLYLKTKTQTHAIKGN